MLQCLGDTGRYSASTDVLALLLSAAVNIMTTSQYSGHFFVGSRGKIKSKKRLLNKITAVYCSVVGLFQQMFVYNTDRGCYSFPSWSRQQSPLSSMYHGKYVDNHLLQRTSQR